MFTYIYYTLYKFVLITPSKKEMPEHLANTTQVLIWSFNIDFLLRILKLYEVIDLSYLLDNKVNYIFLFVFLLATGYFNFIRGGKHILIKEKYDKENRRIKTLKMSLVFVYAILSFIIPIVM